MGAKVNGQRRKAAFVSRCFPKTIEIPAGLRDWSADACFDGCRISLRLSEVLRRAGVRVLGDLHGRKVGDFAWEENCGFETLHELDSLVSAVASAKADACWASGEVESSAELRRKGEGSTKNDKRRKKIRSLRRDFIIPESVRELRFDELPITLRLGNVCRSIGVRTLGDLNGRTPSELLECKQCGWRTVSEMQQLIERAITGEFNEAQLADRAALAELLTLLEQGIGNLSPQKGEFLLARIEGLTFAEIGGQYGLTRARTHQVVSEALETLRKTYGPRIPRLLEMLKRRCLSLGDGSPLTPVLLEQWLGQAHRRRAKAADSPKRFELPTKEHLHLIAALDKSIPCYMESSPKASGTKELDLDLATLGRALRLATTPEVPRSSDPWPSEYLLRNMLTHM